MHCQLQNGHILLKNVLLKPNFQNKGQLYAHCSFYVTMFSLNCFFFFFQFFICGISMHIPILTGVQKGHNSGYKNGHILIKNMLLQINLQVEGKLDAKCYLHIFAFLCKFFFFLVFKM